MRVNWIARIEFTWSAELSNNESQMNLECRARSQELNSCINGVHSANIYLTISFTSLEADR